MLSLWIPPPVASKIQSQLPSSTRDGSFWCSNWRENKKEICARTHTYTHVSISIKVNSSNFATLIGFVFTFTIYMCRQLVFPLKLITCMSPLPFLLGLASLLLLVSFPCTSRHRGKTGRGKTRTRKEQTLDLMLICFNTLSEHELWPFGIWKLEITEPALQAVLR